jgi:tRNA threonylcarbamoyladenosine biosynthesis protein TsaE
MMDVYFTLNELGDAVSQLLQRAGDTNVIAFHGEMGTGKTTFIHALCDSLEVKDAVSSPTFPIINEYESSRGPIFHIDLYRLKDQEEAVRAGVEDCLYSGSLCLVEWPDRAPGLFPGDTLHVFITMIDEKTRLIRIADN